VAEHPHGRRPRAREVSGSDTKDLLEV
jgi:hypothetical protein